MLIRFHLIITCLVFLTQCQCFEGGNKQVLIGLAKSIRKQRISKPWLLGLRAERSDLSLTLSDDAAPVSLQKLKSVRGGEEDLEDPEHKRLMVLIKILFLSYYASLGSLMPYLPVYYHSLGHGGLIIGMLGAVKPLTTFLLAPFWGVLSDRSDDKFMILRITFLVSLLGQLAVSLRDDVYFLTAMVFITAIMNAPVKSLIDSMVMDHLSVEDRNQYGRLRLWGQLGFGLGSSCAGLILSRSLAKASSPSKTTTLDSSVDLGQGAIQWFYENALQLWNNLSGYKLLFCTYAALSIPTWLCLKTFQRMDEEKATRAQQIGKVKKKVQKETAHIVEGLRLLVQNRDAMLFFFLVFAVGVSSGCIENFAYVAIRECGGSGKEMGLSRLVSSLAGAPMFWFSGPLTQKLGADRVLVLSLFSYVVRFFIYAFMKKPYHALPAEALRGFTFGAFWSTGTVYAHRISPSGMTATMLMFLNAMYGGLGQSLGALIGGKLQHRVGTVKTFVYSGIFDLGLVGLVILHLSSSRTTNFRNPQPIGATSVKEKQKPKSLDVGDTGLNLLIVGAIGYSVSNLMGFI